MAQEQLTRQDLIFIARALRVSAGVDDAKGAEGKFVSSKATFENSAKEQRALADKVERIAKRMR